MSPARVRTEAPPRVQALTAALALDLGREVRGERTRRAWRLTDLAHRAGASVAMIHGVEQGEPSSLDGYARLAVAMGLEPRFTLLPERAARVRPDADPVHAALGEIEAEHFRALGFEVLLDEPYQHYQFAGRGDVVVIDRPGRAMLHIENKTRFPDIQEFTGSFNSKRAYLAPQLASRLRIPGGFVSVTHVVVALWSSEVLHTLRLRQASFRSVCPDAPALFGAWWSGATREPGTRSELVIFDPLPHQRRRRWVGLDALRPIEPRYHGYADALRALRDAGRA